jgi:hypothetical protein
MQVEMQPEDLAAQLFGAAEKYAASKGRKFKKGAESHLRTVASKGAVEVFRLPASERAKKIDEADAAFREVIDAMETSAGELPGYVQQNRDLLGEQTFQRAMNRLCPIWPFCP